MGTHRIAWAAALGLAVGLPAGCRAELIAYNFTLIADNTGSISGFNSNIFPSINAGGTVAFEARLRTGVEGIFTGDGGPIATVATNAPGSPFSFFGPGLFAGPSINANGTVAFRAFLQTGGQGIFTSDRGTFTTVADTSGPFRSFQGVAINNSGAVAFGADLTAGGSSILTGSGGVFTTIADSGGLFGGVAINDGGVVAFLTNPVLPGAGLFTGNGGPLTTIATTSVEGPFFQITEPSINAGGTVAFLASLVSGGMLSGFGIFTGDGGPTTAIADTSGPYSLLSGPSINTEAMVAFRAVLDTGGVGIFTGPDPMADRVIVSGDPLFGSSIVTLDFAGGQALNDAGQITFRAGLADGRTVIVRADPFVIPEPSTLTLLGLGCLGLVAYRCRPRGSVAGLPSGVGG